MEYTVCLGSRKQIFFVISGLKLYFEKFVGSLHYYYYFGSENCVGRADIHLDL